MSEKTEAAESKPVRKQSSSNKQADGSSGAFLAMVIALAAGGGSYYLWQQHLVAEQDRQALEKSIEQLLEVVEEKDRAQHERIEQLRDHRHDKTKQRIEALEQSLPDLSQQLSLQQRDWSLAEVDYLLRLAEHRLQISRDVPTAISALSQAQEQLGRYTNGNFIDVINVIDENIYMLNSLEQHSISHITARLGELLAKLETLPFAIQTEREVEPAQAPEPLPEDASIVERIKHWGRVVWSDIKSLVTIRRTDETSRPLMDPEQRYFLQAQLRLKLETARLAAMGGNQPLYTGSLKEAANWLSRYYERGNSEVIATTAALNELAEISVSPELPSLQGIRQLLHSQRPQAPVPAAPLPTEAQPAPVIEPKSGVPTAAEQETAPAEDAELLPVEPTSEPSPVLTAPVVDKEQPADIPEFPPAKAPVMEEQPQMENAS